MKILVLFKTVPIVERVLDCDWETFSLHSDLSYAGKQINCFDESALEIGLRLMEECNRQGQCAECFAATAGDLHPFFAQMLFAAGYQGIEQIGMESAAYEFAPEATAAVLSSFVRQGQYDIILTGSVAGMADTGTVPLILADMLSLPLLPDALEAHICDGGVDTLCQDADGIWLRSVKTPVIISVGNSPAVLRATTLQARLAAKNKDATLSFADRVSISRKDELFFSRSDEKRACRYLMEASPTSLAGNLLHRELSADIIAMPAKPSGFYPLSAVIYDTNSAKWYAPDEFVAAMIEDWRVRKPDYALLPDTSLGRMLAYRLAKAVDCFFMTGASFSEDGKALCRRTCASNVILTIKQRVPAILTMRNFPDSAQKATLNPHVSCLPTWLMRDELRTPATDSDLKNKNLVIVCGAGIGSREHCEQARILAKQLNAGFGVTRMAAQNGWGEPGEIVGQSGTLLQCAHCLVLGVSGASAFRVGLEGVSRVIAVNSDRNAPIFKDADIGVVADAPSIVRALLDKEANSCE